MRVSSSRCFSSSRTSTGSTAKRRRFLDVLVESLPTARLLLLVNYRPEYQHRWGSRTAYSQLRLDPLPPETPGELLRRSSGTTGRRAARAAPDRPGRGGTRSSWRRVSGPWSRRKLLSASAGPTGSSTPLHDLQVPATVEAILAARIDRLPAEDKRLLQVAAVIGKDVPFACCRPSPSLPEDAL